ncbi:hypothetical protein F511_42286 [Dorcoceras hygrometricum]|uniref:Uncharacterized protein n=1 Tax=Dorcoceras hygrometricum TaxID=472368 RepID=A0A2Z7C812_9LAMI|nr:hypothetical protein F511_42286 [Dorcoceras hygrometricum]
MFAAAFELPTEGLIDLTDVPKNFVFDARSLFSDSKEQVSEGLCNQICVLLRKVQEWSRDVTDAPRVKKTPVKKMVSKKRQATGDAGETCTDVPVSEEQPVADPDDIIEQILIQMDTTAATQGDNTETWFDRAFDKEFATTEQETQDSEEEIIFDIAKNVEEASSSKHHLRSSCHLMIS